MKVTIFETEPWEEQAFRSGLGDHDLRCVAGRLDETTAGAFANSEVLSTSMNSILNDKVLGQFPALRLIVTRSVGFDHIDLNHCRTHGITVCNIPDYGDYAVAEHAFALLLAISRRIVPAVEECRKGRFGHGSLRGFELQGKTLGVIGTGRIGRRAIEISQGFGMKVIAYDIRPDGEAARSLRFSYVPLDELVAVSNVISLHLPATPTSRHILSDREFARMKPGVIIINTARGSVLDLEALLRALDDGRVAAAGIDVLPHEPELRDEAQIFRRDVSSVMDFRAFAANRVVLDHPNVLVTPHNAYNTAEAMQRIVDSTIAIIRSFAQGTPENVVYSAAA